MVYDSGWVEVDSGQTTQIVVPAGDILWARVRWKGISVEDTDSDSNTETGSGSGGASKGGTVVIPSKPSGWTWDRVRAYTSVSASVSGSWEVGAVVEAPEQTSSGTGTSGSVSDTDYGTPSVSGTSHSATHEQAFSYTFRATGYWTDDVDTLNPKVTIGGVATQLTDTLNDAEESAWVDLTGVANGTNNVLHTISGSATAYVQIQVEYGAGAHSGTAGLLIF